ncbi:MAG: TatD family nuclease-associated radical SAM protein [Christensenellales bacterium]
MSDTYIYMLGEAVYINLTNRCTNDCIFCVRNEHDGVGGYNLRLTKEPEANDIISALEKLPNVEKAVFCGLGEPTMRINALIAAAKYLKSRGAHIRLNTNGQGSACAGEDIVPKLAGLIDVISISLNASSAKEYQRMCQSAFGDLAYSHMLEFAKSCVAHGIDTVMSVVDIIGEEEVEKCREIARRTGARFRVRKYIS